MIVIYLLLLWKAKGTSFILKHSKYIIILLVAYLNPAWADEGVVLTPTVVKNISSESAQQFKKNLAPFNEKDYTLAYDVFLMNGNVDFAYTIAEKAVQAQPKSTTWRKKLIQAALWGNRPNIALTQYLYLVDHHIEQENYIQKALTLAEQLNNFDAQAKLIEMQLQQSPHDKVLSIKYSKALLNQGYPNRVLQYLNSVPQAEKDPEYLKILLSLAIAIDNPHLALQYAHTLWSLGKRPEEAMQYAGLLSLKGDFKGAYRVYQDSLQAQELPSDFLIQYGNIALLAGKNRAFSHVYHKLLHKEVIDKISLLELIRLEAFTGEVQTAYQDAEFAYQKYHYAELIPVILELGERLKKWKEIKSFLVKIPSKELAKLEKKPQFALLLIAISGHLNMPWEASKTWQWVFQRWPNLKLVQRAYLWYLMDNGDYAQLKYTLKRWKNQLRNNQLSWRPYAAGLIDTGEYKEALRIFLKNKKQVRKSYELLANLADLFNQNDRPDVSYYLSRRALSLLFKQIYKQKNKISLEQRLLLTELVQAIGPATLSYNLILSLNKYLFIRTQADNQIVAWALKNQNYSLAYYIAQVKTLKKERMPPWMTLTLALIYNDKDSMANMLQHYPDVLPYRDKVIAATLTNQPELAQDLAYHSLHDHPDDQEMYKLFTQTMLPASNRSSVGGEIYGLGAAVGPVAYTSARLFVSPSLSVAPYEIAWFPHTNDINQIAWTPDIDNSVGVIIRKSLNKGWVGLTLGERTSLKNIVTAKLRGYYPLNSASTALLSLGYHQRSSETVPLLVAGMKNEARLQLTYRWDSYNTFDSLFKLQQYLGQDETFLGTGQVVQGRWQHKFYLSYPDWNVNVYGTTANFQNSNNPLSYSLKRIVPNNTIANTVFYMPINYVEGALTAGFGQEYKRGYTHSWKPFMEAGLLYSFPFGLGELAEGGIGGSVFGRDHLAFYASYSINQQQASQINYTVGIRYDSYF